MQTQDLIRDTGSTDPSIRYGGAGPVSFAAVNYQWHGYPQWLKDAATAYRQAEGYPGSHPHMPFIDGFFRNAFYGLFDHEFSVDVEGVTHFICAPYKNIFPVARQFAEALGIEIVSHPGEVYRGEYVYEFRPAVKGDCDKAPTKL